ncbi:MAG: efflux RND transporter permease subunit [Pirellulaceae bacterium]
MKSLVQWAISNSPAMNVLLLVTILVGWFSFQGMQRETFPDFDIDTILISVPYPGAAPQEVEEGICQKIEEAVRSLDGIKKVSSVSQEGSGSVILQLEANVRAPDRVLDEVRSEVDRIPSFPLEAEDPEIRLVTTRRPVIRVAVTGPETWDDGEELRLRNLAERVRDEMLQLNGVSQVDFVAARDFQIDVEIPEDTLRSYGLSLGEVAETIRSENRELPAGVMRAESQEILLRGNNRRVTGPEIAQLPLISQPGGAVLTVGDLGTVRDAFDDVTAFGYINRKPAMALSVERSSDEDLLLMIDAVKDYVANASLPEGYQLVTWSDESIEVRGRLNMLYENSFLGLLIVFTLLVLFLDLKLAFWVAIGIPFSVLAAGSYLYFDGHTLNMISMFGFLMALGIVVDDAIVVGENIYAHREQGKSLRQAAIDGTLEVMPSVMASIATTVIAFLPLMFVAGVMGKFIAVMPMAIIAMLLASLFESVTILPCHLAHSHDRMFRVLGAFLFVFKWLLRPITWASSKASGGLAWFIDKVYLPALGWSLVNRSVMVAAGISILLVTFGLIRSGVVQTDVFPKLDGNTIQAMLKFPDGTPEHVTRKWVRHIEDSFWEVNEKLSPRGESLGVTSFSTIGTQVSAGGPPIASVSGGGSHVGSVEIELQDTEERTISSDEIITHWRDAVGKVPGAESLAITSRAHGPGGKSIEFKLLASGADLDQLEQAVDRTKQKLAQYPGVQDIADDSLPGKWEYRFRIKPRAYAMNVTNDDLAETVRAAYFGNEVMRVQRGRHEVKIMVRYPLEDRRRFAAFDDLRVRLQDGSELPITELAEVEIVRGYSAINRQNQKRSVTITADVDIAVARARDIVLNLQEESMPEILAAFPAVDLLWEGQQEQETESFESMQRGFLVALLAMFLLLSFEFKSYFQPLLILGIIPFGVVGAVLGHALLGIPLTLFSMFGLVALTGIVLNDSIVLVDFINHRVRDGMPLNEALLDAGRRRFRPVMLTTLTTVGGLSPLLLETSLQAQLLIPMAASIAFGEIFATVIVLFMVPIGYSLQASFLGLFPGGELVPEEHEEYATSARG